MSQNSLLILCQRLLWFLHGITRQVFNGATEKYITTVCKILPHCCCANYITFSEAFVSQACVSPTLIEEGRLVSEWVRVPSWHPCVCTKSVLSKFSKITKHITIICLQRNWTGSKMASPGSEGHGRQEYGRRRAHYPHLPNHFKHWRCIVKYTTNINNISICQLCNCAKLCYPKPAGSQLYLPYAAHGVRKKVTWRNVRSKKSLYEITTTRLYEIGLYGHNYRCILE